MTYSEKEINYIVADSFDGISYKCKRLLLASLNEEIADREKYSETLIKTIGAGVYNKLAADFRDEDYRNKTVSALERAKVGCVTVKSANYPEKLLHIPVPPLVLYYRGNPQLLSGSAFAIVGSRKTSPAVLGQCKEFSGEIAGHMTVVTGVADGADSAAIGGAIASGRIICVLPGGHSAYTASNIALIRRVEKSGLVISEFPPAFKAQRHTFFLRNRLIAGLCEGVLVVSAAEKSGALSTAGYAADYSKDVFAFPYGLGVPSGQGCNNLIKSGAMLCDSVDDILEYYGIKRTAEPEEELSEEEAAIVRTLRENGEMHAQRLAQELDMNLTDVVTVCAMLEIKGLLVRSGGNTFAAV